MVNEKSCLARREIIRHPNGQTSAYILDSFVDPWKPAETILLQHGFGRTADHFYEWVPNLARHYHVIRRDLRGHGLSSYPGPEDREYDYSTDTIIDEILDTLDQLNVKKVHFLGESTSGILAEIFAARHPGRVGSIIICSSPTHLPRGAQDFLAFGMPSWPTALRQLGSRGWAERLASTPGTMVSDDPSYVQWWMDQVSANDGEGLAGYAEFLSQVDSRPFLGDIRAPMLILAPTNSAVVPVASMEELARSVPNAQLRVVESRGHEIYAEAAQRCQAIVLQFLEQLRET
ncbi:hypothetical protein ACJZ2D_008619 [Fusarium nematophilum]